MKLKYLILDDDHERHHEFTRRIASTSQALEGISLSRRENAGSTIAALIQDEYEHVFLDHDLDGRVYVPTDEENTGSEVARFLANNPDIRARHGKVIVHSFNGPAAMAMVAMIPNSEYIPGLWTREVWEAAFPLDQPAKEPQK